MSTRASTAFLVKEYRLFTPIAFVGAAGSLPDPMHCKSVKRFKGRSERKHSAPKGNGIRDQSCSSM